MLSHAGKRLADDHVALDEVLKALQAALNSGDSKTAFGKLELFWARLAVHIRAEHLHLFPAVSSHSGDANVDRALDELRADHDFFMHELARAIAIVREVLNTRDSATIIRELNAVREVVVAVEQRLVVHNEIEESQVYRLATDILREQEQAELALKINKELANHPPRFAADTWLGE